MVNLSFLPKRIQNSIELIDISDCSEIRLRIGYPVFVRKKGKKVYLSERGVTLDRNIAIVCVDGDVNETILNITERSIYAFNDKLKNGFITTKDGVRVGVCGECVFDNGKIVTIKKFTSLNIRIPHEIRGCSAEIYKKIFSNGIFNTLIISPPAKGKTTILKDLARNLNFNTDKSILIIDERGEFGEVVGENIDLIRYSDKTYALNLGIRSMSPNIVITDELRDEKDWQGVGFAVTDGINVIATCHGKSLEDVKNKPFFNKNIFERYVVLDANRVAGTVKDIFDKELKKI